MEESIRELFQLGERDIRSYSPLTLAYLGDSVYELILRTVIVEQGNRPPKELHKAGSHLAKAKTQAMMMETIRPLLTEEEQTVYRRGRNANTATMAKHASMQEYRKATGLEALMAYLYLQGRIERLLELIRVGWENVT